MSKNLIIVESPTKAKTLEKFLDSNYRVLSSQGHIRDIEGTGKNSMGIDFAHNYAPNYVIDEQKKSLISTLMTEASKADTIWLASDADREGEAIAWHLKEVLQLPDSKTHRIEFHEITKTAIQEAIAHPRDIDYHLVDAQQARRVLDRIVGYELSPVLWRKVTTGLSAGRVQSVAVRLIVEREREIEEFVPQAQYRLTAQFQGADATGKKVQLRTELGHRFASKTAAVSFLEQCGGASFSLTNISHKPGKRTPAAPFTTSTLQQEASRKLHFTVSKTMRLAQALYEAGKITYMRTDSVHLSSLAIRTAQEVIVKEYGEKYHQSRQFVTSSKGAQEAHEAIRPTFMDVTTAGANADERKLYELIRRRTLASQMADAQTQKVSVEIAMQGCEYPWTATTESVLFDGFMRLYQQSVEDESEVPTMALPDLVEGQSMTLLEATAQETYSKQPQRYNEAMLVDKMEKLGIGRPSTYATVIETIQSRHYVERGNVEGTSRAYNVLTWKQGQLSDQTHTEQVGADTGKLLPTDLGRMTNDFLVNAFPEILSYDFTAQEEENFDAIAEGKRNWVESVDAFYKTFHPMLENVPKGKVAGRYLGVDPKSGRAVYARISKNGPCAQIGDSEDTQKPQFTSLQKGQSIYTITLEEALKLFETAMPYQLCEWFDQPVVVGEGKFGPYIQYAGVYVSIPKNMDPHTITPEQAKELYAQYRAQTEPIHEWGTILIMRGRYGAYIKTPEGNYRIPRSMDAEKMTLQDCQTLIASGKPTLPEVGKKTFSRKKAK